MKQWQKIKLCDALIINPIEKLPKGIMAKKISMEKLLPFHRDILEYEYSKFSGGSKFRNNDTIMARITPCLENGKRAKVGVLNKNEIGFGSTEFIVFRKKENISDADFIYYLICSDQIRIPAIKSMVGSSGRQRVQIDVLKELIINLPPLDIQKKIAGVLGALDDKIKLNNKINNNLEQQVQALFNEMFLEDMVSVHSKHHLPLSELVQNIDNRGKTPPLSPEKTDFPIIDVKALSGNTRIINYDNCTKFVSQETYLTGFRNGLPQKYDILLSTVGSLGEMKLFIEPKGCIAQNVIGYRSKISPLYLYQYLKTIKNDLLAYDIGSVQPSIKVTHIAKHPILVPDKNKLKEFHGIAEAITNKIYINSQENTRFSALRDALLPKLMSGEIDVSKVDINKLNAADMLL